MPGVLYLLLAYLLVCREMYILKGALEWLWTSGLVSSAELGLEVV